MIKKMIYKAIGKYYKHQGFHDSYGTMWFSSAKQELKESPLPLSKKLWALKRGFYPFRIEQYGLTEENYDSCLSDREYKRLFPINNKYKIWIDDKITTKYVLSPFDEFMPRYYYHLLKARNCHIMRLMDCPEDYSDSYEDILKLLRNVESLAIKPTGGTRGAGFYKVEFKDENYFLNGNVRSEEEMYDFFHSLEDHIVIEFIKMHKTIADLYPDSLNTIRVMLINENGNNPIIPTAYMRIGTKASGIVDNVSRGGMFCKIDVDSGKFYGGEKLSNHIISPSPVHPDTGKLVEGIIPNWDLVKTKLTELANYLPQLEWLGIDVAITENGFNIIEINSHQDLHRYHTYPNTVKEYFKRKSSEKN